MEDDGRALLAGSAPSAPNGEARDALELPRKGSRHSDRRRPQRISVHDGQVTLANVRSEEEDDGDVDGGDGDSSADGDGDYPHGGDDADGTERKRRGVERRDATYHEPYDEDVTLTPQEEEEALSLPQFDVMCVIGSGEFGRVVRVREKHTNPPRYFALKIIDKKWVESKWGEMFRQRVRSERAILASLRHEYLPELVFEAETQRYVVLGMELIRGVSLKQYVDELGPLTEKQAKFLAAEMVLALDHLHMHSIMHRGICPENIMIDAEGRGKLVDLSMAVKLTKKNKRRETSFGAASFRPPEMVEGRPYGFAVDWWQLGIIVYFVLTGTNPFESRWRGVEAAIKQGSKAVDFPDTMSTKARDLISKLLETNPHKRLAGGSRFGAKDVQVHPFFRGVDWLKVGARMHPSKLVMPEYLVPSIPPDEVPEFASVDHVMVPFDEELDEEQGNL